MTSTTWTFGGGGVAAETFLFPHPPDKRLKTKQPRIHILVVRLGQPTVPSLLLPDLVAVADLTGAFEVHSSHIIPSRFWRSFYSQTAALSRIDTAIAVSRSPGRRFSSSDGTMRGTCGG